MSFLIPTNSTMNIVTQLFGVGEQGAVGTEARQGLRAPSLHLSCSLPSLPHPPLSSPHLLAFLLALSMIGFLRREARDCTQ